MCLGRKFGLESDSVTQSSLEPSSRAASSGRFQRKNNCGAPINIEKYPHR